MDIKPNDDDEIIAEVRRNRKAFCARFGNDWDLIHEYLKQCDAENPDKVVSFSEGPKFPAPAHDVDGSRTPNNDDEIGHVFRPTRRG